MDKNNDLCVSATWQFVWSDRIVDIPTWPLDQVVITKNAQTRYGGPQATIELLDRKNRKLHFQDGSSLGYSSLVLAPGVVSDPSQVPGLASSPAIDICSLNHVEMMRDKIRLLTQNTTQPQTIMVLVTRMPYSCPPIPFECASLLDDLMRMHNVREHTRIILAVPVGFPFAGPPAKELFCNLLDKMQVEYWPCHEVNQVESHSDGKMTVRFTVDEKDSVETTVDALFCTFPQRAPDFMQPICNEKGFCTVDLQTNKYDNDTFVIGDACHTVFPKVKKPHPKAGEFAYLMGQYVAVQLLCQYRNASPPAPPRRSALWVAECGVGGQGVNIGPDFSEIMSKPEEGLPQFLLETVDDAMDRKGDWVDGYIYKFFGKQFPRFTEQL